MVKTKRAYILATSFTSALGAILSLVALGTEHWVNAKGEFSDEFANDQLNEIKYGLFSGTFLQNLGGSRYYTLYKTCLVKKNVCAYLCMSTSEQRQDELEKLYRNYHVNFNCPSVIRTNNEVELRLGRSGIREGERKFINAGLHFSTIVFLGISAVFGLISAVLSVWNTAGNPVEVVFSIYGIYIYNLIACIGSVITLIMWGTLFSTSIIHNVGILYTIQGQMSTNGLTYLGFSYWLNLPSCFLYVASIFILYLRQYFISQEPEIKIHVTSSKDDIGETLMIY